MASIIRINDVDDSDYDLFIVKPADLSDAEAVALVDAAIDKVRDTKPDTYHTGDLNEALAVNGMAVAELVTSTRGF